MQISRSGLQRNDLNTNITKQQYESEAAQPLANVILDMIGMIRHFARIEFNGFVHGCSTTLPYISLSLHFINKQ